MPTPGPLSHCRFLIVHADKVMATTLASALEHRGADIVGIHVSADAALAEPVSGSGAAAVLDAAVDRADRVAAALAKAGIPYVIIADPDAPLRKDLCAAAVVSAPVAREDLMRAILALCRAISPR